MIESQFHSGQVVLTTESWKNWPVGEGGVFAANCSVQHAEASAGWERHPQPLGRKVGYVEKCFGVPDRTLGKIRPLLTHGG